MTTVGDRSAREPDRHRRGRARRALAVDDDELGDERARAGVRVLDGRGRRRLADAVAEGPAVLGDRAADRGLAVRRRRAVERDGLAGRGTAVFTAIIAVGGVLTNSSAPRSLAAPAMRGWPSRSVAESPRSAGPPLSMTGASARRW